jgi:prepilin-type N-terminal cleavage/methylation domain-containing protein/prepilin-type processing-associated H-X9-DG protein
MKRAFTLIELLVVIAIIAVLGAILFPVFAKARERAKCTQCISNLKQIGVAIGSYTVDWDDKYPWGQTTFAAYAHWVPNTSAWYEALDPYVKNRDIWKCPSDIGEIFPNDPYGFKKKTPPFWQFMYTSYGYEGLKSPGLVLAGYPSSRVKRPPKTPLSMEYRPWHGGYDPQSYRADYDPAPVNVLYCDGHVERRSWKQLTGDEVHAFDPG